MAKTKKMENLLENMASELFDGTRKTLTDDKNGNPYQLCVFCQRRIKGRENFKDDLSFKEFGISGICQECQDKTFGE